MSGDDRTRTRVWAALLSFASNHQLKREGVPFYHSQAVAALERSGGDDESQAQVELALGNEMNSDAKFVEARAHQERALALRKKLDGPESIGDRGVLLMNIANSYANDGMMDEALPRYRSVLDLYEKTVG